MEENAVLRRGKHAGNVLLAKAVVSAILSVFGVLSGNNSPGFESELLLTAIGGIVGIALMFVLINPLKNDNIESIRLIYIILGSLSALALYFSFTDDTSGEAIISLLGVVVYVLVITALYNFGKIGKICCFLASGISFFTMLLEIADPEFSFPYFVDSVLSSVYYVFLGLYVGSKGVQIMEPPIIEESPAVSFEEQPDNRRDKYDELIKLKELMDNGIITPAEYEAKKKQILEL